MIKILELFGFPYPLAPLKVTGVSYPMTSTFFKNPLFAFPSPFEVTGVSY